MLHMAISNPWKWLFNEEVSESLIATFVGSKWVVTLTEENITFSITTATQFSALERIGVVKFH